MSWATRPANWGKPGHAELGSETEAILDQIELLTDSAIPVVKYKTVDETVNNSSAYQNDDHLLWSVLASSIYLFELHLFYFSGTTPDIKFQFTAPSGAAITWGGVYYNAAAALTSNGNFSLATSLSVGGTGGDAHASLYGTLITSTSPGDFRLQWAQDVANASNTIIYDGSYGLLSPYNA